MKGRERPGVLMILLDRVPQALERRNDLIHVLLAAGPTKLPSPNSSTRPVAPRVEVAYERGC